MATYIKSGSAAVGKLPNVYTKSGIAGMGIVAPPASTTYTKTGRGIMGAPHVIYAKTGRGISDFTASGVKAYNTGNLIIKTGGGTGGTGVVVGGLLTQTAAKGFSASGTKQLTKFAGTTYIKTGKAVSAFTSSGSKNYVSVVHKSKLYMMV